MPKRSKHVPTGRKFLPPSPLELAKLAALLNYQNGRLETIVKRAVSGPARYPQLEAERQPTFRDLMINAATFYFAAEAVHTELSTLSEESLTALLVGPRATPNYLGYVFEEKNWMGTSGTTYMLYSSEVKPNQPRYEDDFKNGLDPARNYLYEHGDSYNWKRVSSVLKTILALFENYAQEHNRINIDTITAFEQKVDQIAKEMGRPREAILAWNFWNDGRQRLTGEKLNEQFLSIVAVRGNAPAGRGTSRGQQPVIGWKLTNDVLDMLVKCRNSLKKTHGGITGLIKKV